MYFDTCTCPQDGSIVCPFVTRKFASIRKTKTTAVWGRVQKRILKIIRFSYERITQSLPTPQFTVEHVQVCDVRNSIVCDRRTTVTRRTFQACPADHWTYRRHMSFLRSLMTNINKSRTSSGLYTGWVYKV